MTILISTHVDHEVCSYYHLYISRYKETSVTLMTCFKHIVKVQTNNITVGWIGTYGSRAALCATLSDGMEFLNGVYVIL